jgi:hypothetical protein
MSKQWWEMSIEEKQDLDTPELCRIFDNDSEAKEILTDRIERMLKFLGESKEQTYLPNIKDLAYFNTWVSLRLLNGNSRFSF